jgi:hypothetical protein
VSGARPGTGLDRVTRGLLWAALALALLHHADHVLRVDHSGWPFRAAVTPFTFSLIAYPVIGWALLGAARHYWWRWAALTAAAALTLVAHIAVEPPAAQFTMWSANRSLDAHAAGVGNLLHARSDTLGALSVAIAMALNVTVVTIAVAMLANGLRRRR